MTATQDDAILWAPSPARASATLLERFRATAPGSPDSYEALWEWSVRDIEGFWAKVWEDCGVRASSPYRAVVEGDRHWTEIGPEGRPQTWFPGSRLNFAENLLTGHDDDREAIIGAGEGRGLEHLTYGQLRRRVMAAAAGLRGLGVGEGDRVAAYLPNCVETVVLGLAAACLGAVWSSASPDFGASGVVERFEQIEPKVLCVADGYRYNGTLHRLTDKNSAVLAALPSVEHVVAVGFAGGDAGAVAGRPPARPVTRYADLTAGAPVEGFAQLPFDHPLYVMYSSGTTGKPKSIVHGAGGTLVKHLVEHQLHADIKPGDVVFWFTTTGWMMWNWLVTALASGAAIVVYDGSPSQPDLGAMWRLAQETGITHFGTSPKFLGASAKAGIEPSAEADLSALRALMSTGSPLSPELFDWCYAQVKSDMQLASISGGTDIIGGFAGGVPTLPVRRGELQARSLGMAVESWDAEGRAVADQRGELVCTRPFPSMPVRFWGDADGRRYRESYFSEHPGVWTHGDFMEVRAHGGVVIHGRSDTTLNPGGVRIGTAEIYRVVEQVPEVVDSIVVGRHAHDDVEVVLCVKLRDGASLDDALRDRIASMIRAETTPRHVPRHILAVRDIPYTVSGKKVEKAVRSVLAGEPVDNRDALANPESLDEYAGLLRADG